MDNNKIGKFIRKLREEKGWNQEELAEKLYVSRNNLSDIENGKTMLSPDKAFFLGDIFNVSIIDIYNGQTLDKNDVVKTNETINNINESIIKSTKLRYVKIILGVVLCFVLIIFIFLVYYFFNSYNSVKFYKVSGESDNFNTNRGLLVVSKENIHFSLSVESKNNQNIDMITLRYKDNYKDELIQQVTDNYFYITDYYNYNEYFDYNTIVKEKGNFYIEIKYGDEKEILNLSTIKQYENKRLLFRKEKPIADDTKVPKREKVKIPDKILEEFTYDEKNNSYSKRIAKNKNVLIVYMIDANLFIVEENYKEYYKSWQYFLDTSELFYLKNSYNSKKLENQIILDKDNDFELYNYFFNNYFNKYFK